MRTIVTLFNSFCCSGCSQWCLGLANISSKLCCYVEKRTHRIFGGENLRDKYFGPSLVGNFWFHVNKAY